MPNIVPRWEWRIFGSRLKTAEDWLAPQASTGTQETDEVYFLCGKQTIVKLRHNLMDIKTLRETNADGLERWEPTLKAAFPLSLTDAKRTFEAIPLAPPSLSRGTWSVEDFTNDFAGHGGPMRAIPVHKKRIRYAIDGCLLELSDVVVEGKPTRTLAIESEDAAAVTALVRTIGFEGLTNRSYLCGLAALVDDEPERYAVIDVGTNSVKLHIAQHGADGTWRRVVDRSEVTRLGEGLEANGEIAADPLVRTTTAISAMAHEARGQGVRAIAAVGTAGLRQASNRDAVLAKLRSATGVAVEVISGEDEARLAYLAVVTGLGLGSCPVVVFDSGGGSSQFTFGHGAKVDERFSIDVGAVGYTEKFGLAKAVGGEVVHNALSAIAADLSSLDSRPKPAALVGMGGAVTNLTAVSLGLKKYDPDRVQGAKLKRDEIIRQIDIYASKGAEARRSIVGLQPKRAEVILAGACIVHSIMEKLGQDVLTVSDRGLRHGVLIERFGS